MWPTIHSWDHVIVQTDAYARKPPMRNDIVTFFPPIQTIPPNGTFLKRIVGIPGDRISSKLGRLYVNGKLERTSRIIGGVGYDIVLRNYELQVTYLPSLHIRDENFAIKGVPHSFWRSPDRIPANYYLLLGDYRFASEDSHTFGLVRRNAIEGKVVAKL